MTQRPLSRYTIEDCANMPIEKFEALLEANNEWVREHYAQLKESNKPRPKFNTIEELDAYYNCRPLEEVLNKANEMFGF